MEQKKVYCGSGKEKFDGNLIEISICLSDLPKDKIFEYDGKKYIKLKVGKKREEDRFGKTHYVEVDMFEPKKEAEKEAGQKSSGWQKAEPEIEETDSPDLPF